MQGQLDTELTELGRAQAVGAAEALAKRQPLLVVSSDLRRAYDTAVALGERTGLPVQVDEPVTRDPPRRLAGHDARRDRRRRAGRPAGLARGRHLGAAWRGKQGRRGCAQPAVDRRTGRGEPEWGAADEFSEPARPVVLVAHGGLIAALTAALLRLPVANWPALGGMGNASWTQLSGHSVGSDGSDPDDLEGIRWRLDVWNASAQVAGDVL